MSNTSILDSSVKEWRVEDLRIADSYSAWSNCGECIGHLSLVLRYFSFVGQVEGQGDSTVIL